MECIEALLTRRSIREYLDKPVPRKALLKAIDIARYAPSAKNTQPWRFIIVDDPKILVKLSKIHGGAKPLEKARTAIVVASNREESPTSYLVDGSLATMYLWLALHCLGYGAVWIQTLRNTREIQEILELPVNLVPVAILTIGYPNEKPEPKPRKKLEDITYINKYGVKLV